MNRLDPNVTNKSSSRWESDDGSLADSSGGHVLSGRARVAMSADRRASRWVITIACILIVGVLYVGSSLFIPLTLSLLAYLSLRPVVSRLCGWGLPRTFASAAVIAIIFVATGVIAALLYSPLEGWLAKAPASLNRFQSNFADITKPLETLDDVEETAEDTREELGGETEVTVQVEKPDLLSSSYLINTTGSVLAFIAGVGVLTFFMLSTGDDVLNRVLHLVSDRQERGEVLKTIGKIQDNVGTYLSRIAAINLGLGVAVTIVMWLAGMPTPVLWGVLAALFNFIPYVGPLAATGLVLLAAGSYFDSTPRALITAVLFWLTTAVEGQFVTPAVVGRTLKVGPVVVLVAIAFWGFVWGLSGILLAVPLMLVLRRIFASFESTMPFAVVLGEELCDPETQDCDPIQEDETIAESAPVTT